MRTYSNHAFSLIELLVVITIIGIVSLAAYFPYAHHQKRTLVKQGMNEVSQSLKNARNMAIQWRTSWSWNLHIWLFFKDENTLLFQGYDLSATGSISDADIISKRNLPRWVTLTGSLVWTEYFFEAISGDMVKRKLENTTFTDISHEQREEIEISFMQSSSDQFRRVLYYFTKSHISDF